MRTIEFTLKISSKSKITRLHADLNPLSKTQKNLLFGENQERFYALWRERAREIPGTEIHPCNMLLLTLTKSKQQRMDEHEDSVTLTIPRLAVVEFMSGDRATAIVRKSPKHLDLLRTYAQDCHEGAMTITY